MRKAKRAERAKSEGRRGKGGRENREGTRAKPGLNGLWEKLDHRRRHRTAGPTRQAGRAPAAWAAWDDRDETEPSSLGRLYQDVAEHGGLSEPPQSPTRLLELEPLEEEAFDSGSPGASSPTNPSVEESVESLVQTLVDEVYDELAEGSVRLPGAGHQQTGPAEQDDEWLSVEGLVPS